MLDRRAVVLVIAAALVPASGCQQREEVPAEAGQAVDPALAADRNAERPAAEAPPVAQPQAQQPAPAPARTPQRERDVASATGGSQVREEPRPVRPAEPAAPTIRTLPAGTRIEVEMLDSLSSATSQAGDGFRARVTENVTFDGRTVIPRGAVLNGTVTEAKRLAKIGGSAVLALEFSRVELPNGHAAVVHGSILEKGKSETGRDAATIGGATAGGAVLGRVLSKNDKSKGTAIGAIVGAAAGTVIASQTKGQEVEIPAGASLSFELDRAADVPVS